MCTSFVNCTHGPSVAQHSVLGKGYLSTLDTASKRRAQMEISEVLSFSKQFANLVVVFLYG